jgi:hypothetical protein
MSEEKQSKVKGFVRWLFGAPFQALPEPYGDTVPADLRVFETQQAEAQHHAHAALGAAVPHHHRSKPARRREYLERQ